MGYQSRLRQILQNQIGYTDFRKILTDILVLEEKIKNPVSQSIYFHWGMEMHRKKLFVMKDYFEMNRNLLNAYPTQFLNEELDAGQQFLDNWLPLFDPEMELSIRKKAEARIAQLKDFVRIREKTEFLPSVDELRNNPDLLASIIG